MVALKLDLGVVALGDCKLSKSWYSIVGVCFKLSKISIAYSSQQSEAIHPPSSITKILISGLEQGSLEELTAKGETFYNKDGDVRGLNTTYPPFFNGNNF